VKNKVNKVSDSSFMQRVSKIHLIGVGGAGMCGIAEILYNLGYEVSGSDITSTKTIERLQKIGVKTYSGHDKKHVDKKDLVIVSAAIPSDNEELVESKKRKIPIMKRAEMLAELMRLRFGIAVAGTHGKTSTTSLIAHIMEHAGMDPTIIVGGRINEIKTNARLGDSKYLVAEADESDGSFLHLHPTMSVITNIDTDHLSSYKDDFSLLRKAFLDFIHNLPFYGLVALCVDDKTLQELLPEIKRSFVTCAINFDADYRAVNIRYEGLSSIFDIVVKATNERFTVELSLPGEHNILNALAAVAITIELGIDKGHIKTALQEFQGTSRRFELNGELQLQKKKVIWVDDYGHHPTEIIATIKTARIVWPEKRLIVVFQPHRYSRTHEMFENFVDVLSQADVLILLEIYSAGEAKIDGVNSSSLCNAIKERKGAQVIFEKNEEKLLDTLENLTSTNDLLLTMGAGSISSIVKQLSSRLI
jgi:UDP-N-acetylmuramate--alanine ligase